MHVYTYIYRSVSYFSDELCKRQTSAVRGCFGEVQMTTEIEAAISSES